MQFSIEAPNTGLNSAIQHAIDMKTKPTGSLGQLEEIAAHLARVQQTLKPQVKAPAIVVFAADHGIAKSGVSAYPSEVTTQMVANFLAGGAAINAFQKQQGFRLIVVDAGVAGSLPVHPELIDAKIAPGTANFLNGPAMTRMQCGQALARGAEISAQLARDGCTVAGFGEMGIGNTSSAAALMSVFCDLPAADCVGRGTGLDDAGLARKIDVIQQALSAMHPGKQDPLGVLAHFGGFELAMICGAMLGAAENGITILAGGFIATASLLAAQAINPAVLHYCLFSHCSGEQGHRRMLSFLDARPILNLGLRLGEGTGCASALPIVQAAAAFMNHMASFEEAGVSGHDH